MEQRKQNDTGDREEGRSLRVVGFDGGTTEINGDYGSDTYYVVYAQKPFRVLDLRHVHRSPALDRFLQGILRTYTCGCTRGTDHFERELERARG